MKNWQRKLSIFTGSLMVFLFLIPQGSFAQQMIPLPPQTSTYPGMVRGFWFISPVSFTITGLRVPASAGPGTQSIQVMKIHGGGVVQWPNTNGFNFTTLFYQNGAANNTILPASIDVHAGDTIGVLGEAGTTNSYSSTGAPFTEMIGGQNASLHRFLYQGNINVVEAPWYTWEGPGFNIGRIEVYYEIAPPNNAGVDSLINPVESGDFCSGEQPVIVRVSNLGKNALNTVDVDWRVNGVLQTGQSLTFNPPLDSISGPNNSTLVTLGTVDFPFQTPIHIEAWTSNPNGVADTKPSDDTLDLSVTSNMQGVVVTISPGDTFICAGKQLTLNANNQPSGVTFNWNTQATSQSIIVHRTGQYSVKVTSAQGCTDVDTVNIVLYPVPDPGDFGIVDNGNGNFTFTPVRVQNTTDYIWDFGDGDTATAYTNTPQHHQYTQTGTYSVSLTVVAGCLENSATISKQIFYEGNLTGIQTANNLSDGVNIFPNPAKDQLNLSTNAANANLQSITIYDLLGRKVYSKKLQNNSAQISIAILPAGNYMVKIQTNIGIVNSKLEILR